MQIYFVRESNLREVFHLKQVNLGHIITTLFLRMRDNIYCSNIHPGDKKIIKEGRSKKIVEDKGRRSNDF